MAAPAMSEHDAHPSDHRWSLESGAGFRPSINVISLPAEEELHRRRWDAIMRDDLQVERVPFGFARELLLDEDGRPLCGFPHARNPRRFGGCTRPHGHTEHAHIYRSSGPPAAIRPDTTRHNGGHAYQRPGIEEPPA